MDNMYNSSSRNSLKSVSTSYEDVSHVSHITKPVRFDSMMETAQDHPKDDKIYRVNLNILPIFFLELVALGCLGALAYVMRFTDSIPVLTRNARCDGIELDFSTPLNMSSFENVYIDVSYSTLYVISTFIPIGMILLGEIGFFLFSSNKKVVRGGCISCRLYLPIRRLVRFVGVFLFGLFAVSIITDGLKLSTGRLRPYFSYICGNDISHEQERYARLSFPSYYSALSTYSSAYLMCYLHFILSIRASRLLRPSLVFALAAMALLCGANRVALNYNHWEDVFVGHIIGAAAALYLAFGTLECFGQSSRLIQAYNHYELTSTNDEKPLFFRYFRIPHVSYQNRTGLPYPENLSPSLLGEFQGNLHHLKSERNGHI